MRRFRRVPLLCLCALGAPPALGATTLYYSTASAELIYSVDTLTGLDAALMSTPGLNLMDLSSGDRRNVVYGPDTSSWRLVALDVVAQTATVVGSFGAEIRGLAMDTTRGILYGTDYRSLYTVDTGSGQATLVGSLSGPTNLWAMGFDPTMDTLFGVNSDDDQLYTIDTTTGRATPVGATGLDRTTDIFVDPADGVLYAVTNSSNPDVITTLNKGTGRADAPIGILTSTRAVGLAAPHEPSMAVEYAAWRALDFGSGIRIEWSTLVEDTTFGFETWARDRDGRRRRLPGLVYATGSGSAYQLVDASPEALSGAVVSYQIMELTFLGAGDATPWFEVTVSRHGRDRSPSR